MLKTLTKHGNSHALIIDRSIMEQLGITPDTPLQVTLSGDQLIVSRADVGLGEERVEAMMEGLRTRHGRALKRLAE